MGYAEFLKKQSSHKKVLFQIGRLNYLTGYLWVNTNQNIWVTRYSYDESIPVDYDYGHGFNGYMSYGNSGLGEFPPVPDNKPIIDVITVSGGTIDLLKVSTEAELLNNPNSFLWDVTEQLLSIATEDGKNPNYSYSSISIGVAQTFANIAGYYGSYYFDSRIKSISNIIKQRDKLFNGVISFNGGSISFDNIDGFFDDYTQENYYGAEVKIFFGGDDLDILEYETIYTGYIESLGFPGDDFIISFKDNRKILSTKIPPNVFNIIDYPLLNASNEGLPIPLGYGLNKNQVAICLNETEITPLTYQFKFVDTSLRTIKSIDNVYVDNVLVAFTGGSLINGTFIVDKTLYEPGNAVSVDYGGYVKDDNITLMENPIDVIQDILTSYTQIEYNNNYFDVDTWEAARVDSTLRVGLSIDNKKEIIDIIELITSSVFGLFDIDGQGRMTFSYRNTEALGLDTIDIDQYLESVTIGVGSDEYLNSARIAWGKDLLNNKDRYYINDSEREALALQYRVEFEQDFNTVLSYESDVVLLSDEAIETYGGIFPKYSIKTKTQNLGFKIGENININAKKRTSASDNYVRCEIISKSIDLNSFVLTYGLRYITKAYFSDWLTFDDGTIMIFDDDTIMINDGLE